VALQRRYGRENLEGGGGWGGGDKSSPILTA